MHIQSSSIFNRFVLYTELKLSKLIIRVPEPEDLFLLKAQRGDEKDIRDLIELDQNRKLDEELIFKRFKIDILPFSYANDSFLIDNYLFCIDKVFGTKVAKKHHKSI